MNKEDNHIIIEVLNGNGDIKLTKMRNPRALWQNYDYPDEYIFKDVDYVNIFSLIQENQQLKQKVNQLESTLNEVKEIIETKFLETELYGGELVCISVENYKKVKTILDKVGGSNE